MSLQSQISNLTLTDSSEEALSKDVAQAASQDLVSEKGATVVVSEVIAAEQPTIPYYRYPEKRLYKAYRDLNIFGILIDRAKDEKKVWYIAIDFEAAFNAPEKIFEVGLTVWNGKSSVHEEVVDQAFHYIVSEHKNHHTIKPRDGAFNHKNHFLGNGRKSIVMSLKKIGAELTYWFNYYQETGEVVIVVHGGSGDLRDLKKLGCNIDNMEVLDTQLIDQAMYHEKHNCYDNGTTLSKLLARHGCQSNPEWPFHNAGNDALYTMTALIKMRDELVSGMYPEKEVPRDRYTPTEPEW